MQPEQPPQEPPDGRFPALRSRAFRLLWFGLTVSSVGTRMQDATIRWHLYELTHSMVALGLIGLCRFVPLFLFSLVGGSVADAKDRRKILLLTQTVMAAGAAVLALLTQAGMVSATTIYGVSALTAGALAFDNPARHSLVPNLVPRRHFSNAATLISTAFNTATVVGPMLAGLLLQRGSIAIIYWINAASFVAVVGALVCIRVSESEGPPTERVPVSLAAFLEGLRFVWSQPVQVWTIVLDFLATFFASAEALLPVFARNVLHVDAAGYGLLTSASAVGSVTAGAIMAVRPPIARQGITMLAAVAVYGVATIVFGCSVSLPLSLAALAVGGAADTVSTVLRQTIRQLGTPDHLRGRMTAINMVFFVGGPQLGNLEAGLLASAVGAPASVVVGGIGCVIAAALIAAKATQLRTYHGV